MANFTLAKKYFIFCEITHQDSSIWSIKLILKCKLKKILYMGFLKNLGSIVGKVAGGTVGGGIEIAGILVDSNFVQEVGQGVYQSTVVSTETLGSLADGAITAVYGIVTEDEKRIKEGFSEAGNAVKTTVNGVGRTIAYTANGVGEVCNGVANNDLKMAGQGVRKVAKIVAISTLAVGITELLDMGDAIIADTEILGESIISDAEIFSDTVIADAEILSDTEILYENASESVADTHYVEPHWVNGYERADGTYVEGYWRDGDGSTSVNLTSEEGGGYLRSNPSA